MDLKLGVIILVSLIGAASAREVELTKFAPSPKSDFGFLDYGTVRITKLRRNHFTISGDYVLKRNIGPHHIIIFEVLMPNGSLLVKTQKTVCEFMKTDELFWNDLVKVSNMPTNNPCPFPKGNYTIKNYNFDESKLGPVPFGRYIARLSIMEDEKLLTQSEVVLTLSL